jgi:uncharacterized membrane protein YccC
MTWKAWTTGILGLWLLVAAFLNLGRTGNLWNDLAVGIIVAVVGFWMVREKPWQGWVAGLLGLWTIIAAFIPGLLTGSGLLWNNVIVGAVIALAGFAALGGSKRGKEPSEMHEVHQH